MKRIYRLFSFYRASKSNKTTTESYTGVSNKCPTMLTTVQVNKTMDNYYYSNTKMKGDLKWVTVKPVIKI